MTAREFYNRHIGKAVDIDYTAGVQCVDLFKAFTKENYNVWNYNCGNGYANGLWLNRKSKPYYQYFDEVSINNLQDGDWCFWDKGSQDCPNSHVAMYYQGKFLGQNQAGHREATLINISKNGMLGALRPKMYENTAKPSVITQADQILYKGSKVRFDGIFKVDILKSPLSSNLFGCCQLTGCSYNSYKNDKVKSYHWLPTGPFIECDKNGNATHDQVLSGGNSYVKNDNIYNVEDIDIPTNSAKLNINGHVVWVFSRYLYEVSNS